LATHLPTGTISFLFTDIGSSTQKWERMPRQMYDAVALHDALLREAIECHGGVVFKSLGDGVCAAFDRTGPRSGGTPPRSAWQSRAWVRHTRNTGPRDGL
jgi:class 3 adenylate cyclase